MIMEPPAACIFSISFSSFSILQSSSIIFALPYITSSLQPNIFIFLSNKISLRKRKLPWRNHQSNRDEATTNICRLFQLPYPLILDILSRLPVKDIIHCICVCKRFLCLVHDPQFASLHLSKSPPLCILLKSIRVLPQNPSLSHRLQLAHVDADGVNFQVSKLNFTYNIPTSRIKHMSACNGLVCLVGEDGFFYVCNPILGEFIKIPPPNRSGRRGRFWGLGYSSATNQYKLLQSYHPTMAEIYTIGTGTWRSVENAPTSYSVPSSFNAFLNGALHWGNDSHNADEFIHSFDFDAEQFGIVPPPDHFRKRYQKFVGFPMIGVLGECLFIIHFTNQEQVQYDVWVMKEYRVQESWTKQFVVQNLYPMEGIEVGDFYQPMVVLSNGEILMSNDTAIVCYNQPKKQFRRTDFFQIHLVFNVIKAIAYTPCFVSLYNVARGEQISRMQSTRVYHKICTQEFLDCIDYGVRLVNSS